ncbi:LPS-assembly protein LptD [Mesoflavibacter sp. HG96]|uniref:putative LPS assembly protein LptD n=1 Tax=Mesoflavibacter TaxID=444051 RepID=UPI000D10A021|nr:MULTISPECIES: putative LPS assembly protein LptD [Mesoflavibacter]QIJ90208.1 LPS-assembly protein LptD [Mesoflavibacter sp. HG96]QIJ92936.1 LPS-assembly protein LptD [Mesoflavibacter sp. HG37]
MSIQKPSHTFTKIHLKALHTQRLNILFALSFTVFINTVCFAQKDLPEKNTEIPSVEDSTETPQEKETDTTVTILPEDFLETPKKNDSTKNDSIQPKTQLLSSTVTYKATDYMAYKKKESKMYLYNEAEVYYEDMEIKAGSIILDFDKDLVYAYGIKDTLGNYTQKPSFKQGTNEIIPDSIIFNTVTKKGLIYNSQTEQNGGTLITETTKKINDSVYYVRNAKFTTAEDLDDPEYYFLISKGKIVPNSKVITGPTQMHIYDVPTPVWIPFAFFPLTKTRTSGIIFPSFGEDGRRGYFLQNGGYYFAISDYVDLATIGDYFTNGSYGLRLESKYAKRYKFNGNVGFRYENLITSERGFPDYAKNTIYNIRWSHAQDSKANPNSRFSASVNLGSSNYYQQSVNQVNLPNTQNNTLASSVSYSKTFQGEPQANISLTATHSQNTQTGIVNMTLPTFQGSISRIYPFAPKFGAKKGIIQNINFQYNVRAENRINTEEEFFFKSEMFDDAKVGAKHSVPIATNFKVFDYFSVSASANFDEVWTLNPIRKYYDPITESILTEELNTFDAFRTYNFSTSIGTTLYGMFNLDKKNEGKKLQKIRHVVRPSISYNINPAFDNYYDTVEVIDADGTTQSEYTRFENSIFGRPNKNFSSAIGIGVSNNFEAKVRDKDTTNLEPKKITLLNNLNFSTSYNVAGDSLNWSPLRVTGGLQVLNNKMNINFGATLDPYALDANNRKINTFNINNGGSLFRMTSANLTLNYSLSSKSGKSTTESQSAINERLQGGGRADDLFGVSEDFADQQFNRDGIDEDEEEEEESELYNYKIPWNVRFAYAVNYSNAARQDEISSHSLMFSGDIEISPKWSIGGSSSYDFKNKGFGLTQLRFQRDLLSWRMNFSWVPFGTYNRWNFFIGIKSSLLKDLKYEQRRKPDEQL